MTRIALSTTRAKFLSITGMIALTLAACQQNDPAPEPTPTSSEEPRSIFDQEGEGGAKGPVQSAELPPLETTISFADGTNELTEAARAELATVLELQQLAQGGRVILSGHSDSAGSDTVNLRASEQRANAVRDFLIENGLAEDRIKVIVFGEQNPIEPNALPNGEPNEPGRAANRRVEILVRTGGSDAEGDGDRKETLIETLTKPEPGETAEAKSSPTPVQ